VNYSEFHVLANIYVNKAHSCIELGKFAEALSCLNNAMGLERAYNSLTTYQIQREVCKCYLLSSGSLTLDTIPFETDIWNNCISVKYLSEFSATELLQWNHLAHWLCIQRGGTLHDFDNLTENVWQVCQLFHSKSMHIVERLLVKDTLQIRRNLSISASMDKLIAARANLNELLIHTTACDDYLGNQLDYLNSSWVKVQCRMLTELTDIAGPRLSENTKNLINDIIIGILHLLDQSFNRLVRHSAKLNFTSPMRNVYFPNETKSARFADLLRKYGLIPHQIEVIDTNQKTFNAYCLNINRVFQLVFLRINVYSQKYQNYLISNGFVLKGMLLFPLCFLKQTRKFVQKVFCFLRIWWSTSIMS
jgi:hypothetical protein